MFVEKLELTNFRNYPCLSLELGPQYNVLLGRNAQGKTNILEALYLASCARSHRTGRDQELIYRGEDFYQVKLLYQGDRGDKNELCLRYEKEGSRYHRRLFHNGFPLDRLADLFGLFQAVIFAPEDLMLIKKGPQERRRFLDILLSRMSPSYFRNLQLYQQHLRQRNAMLKQLRASCGGQVNKIPSYQLMNMEVWDQKLAELAARIYQSRDQVIQELETGAAEALRQIATIDRETAVPPMDHASTELVEDAVHQENLEIRYSHLTGIEPSGSLEEISRAFVQELTWSRQDDFMRGYTSKGPHRDDIDFLLNGLSARSYASQGQQRSVVLALKMAELALLEEHCGVKAVLLLDDVMSELDSFRRQNLQHIFVGHQVFITCTDPEHITEVIREDPDQNRLYQVLAGAVTPLPLSG